MWLLCFHPHKCKIMSIGKGDKDLTYTLPSKDNTRIVLQRTTEEKDIGVTFDENLTFRQDINTRIRKASSIMGVVRRTYTYLDEEVFSLLFKALVRPHLEYGAPVWSPLKMMDIEAIEKVQRRATKLVSSVRDLPYSERLKKLKLPSLRFRRLRGDVIEAYKLLSGIYDTSLPQLLQQDHNRSTRGHSLKLQKKRWSTSLRGNAFTNRIVNVWNALPEEIVTAPSLNSFKNRLDKHWSDHPWRYDFKADLGPFPYRPLTAMLLSC